MGLLHRIKNIVGKSALVAIAASIGAPAATAQQPIFDWTGFYVGANAGYGWGRSDLTIPEVYPGFTSEYRAFLPQAGRTTLTPRDFVGGIHAGYNLQAGNFLWGVEGDAQYMRLKASRDTGIIPGPVPLNPAHNVRFREDVSANNFFTLRLRSGFVAGPTLFYATGGLAVTRFEFSRDIFLQSGPTNYVGSVSSTKAGWTVGGGLEYAVAPNWTVKAEYLYADFGSVGFRVHHPTISAIYIDSKASLSTHILRFGINRKL